MKLWLQASLGAVLLHIIETGAAATPPVKIALRSSWPAPPLIVEVIESITLEDPDAFFPLVDILTDPLVLPSQLLTSEATYQFALQTAYAHGFLSEPESKAIVEMNLALHAATPKIEAFYQHYGHNQTSKPKDCGSWVDWYGEVVCDVERLVHLAGIDTIDAANDTFPASYIRPKILPFDHIDPPPTSALDHPPRTAIFYASLSSQNFRELHTYLLSLARRPVPHIEYVFRHVPPDNRGPSFKRNFLSGYGVSLDLKKMDYLALDDRHSGHSIEKDSAVDRQETSISTDHVLALLEEAYPPFVEESAKALTEDEISGLGIQAAQLISDSQQPLLTLKQLSQNFPKYMTALVRSVVVNESLEQKVHDNNLKAQAGANIFWLNGAVVKEKDLNPLGLLRLLRKEKVTMNSLTSLSLSSAQAFNLLTHPAVGASQSQSAVMDGIFDASDRPENGGVIVWWNDISKDSRYSTWQPSINRLLQPLFPGQLPSVRLNLFNVVLVLDLSQSSSLNFVAGAVSNIINRLFPFRWGVVPSVETKEGTQMARLFYYLIHTYGRSKTMGFIKRISQIRVPVHLLTPTVDWSLVRSEFKSLVAIETPKEQEDGSDPVLADFDSIIEGTAKNQMFDLEKARAYGERLGATLAEAPQGHAFVNGKHFDLDDTFLRFMQGEVSQQVMWIQEKLYSGVLSEDSSEVMSTYFYDLPSTPTRRNRHIYPGTKPDSLRIHNLVELFEKTGFRTSTTTYVYPTESEQIPLSIYIVSDLDSEPGISLVREALTAIESGSLARVSFIHNPSQSMTSMERSWIFSHLLSKGLLSKTKPVRLLRALGLHPLVSGEQSQAVLSQEDALNEILGGTAINKIDAEEYAAYVKASRLVCKETGFLAGEMGLIVNGRVVGPFESGDFIAADFKTLETYEFQRRTEPVLLALQDILDGTDTFDRASFANLISFASSVISSIQLPDPSEAGLFDTPPRPRNKSYRLLAGNYTAFEFGNNSTARYQFSVLLDPLSETAQKWSSLVQWLVDIPGVFVELHINPARYHEIPLKRFYRYNLQRKLTFDEDGSEVPAEAAFQDLPVEPIYTLAMDVSSSWLVRPREALYDLDNIQLGSLSREDQLVGVKAVFDLDFLVVEGHARDTYTNAPPRGLQLELVDGDSQIIDDTQVVANLGYLQFKAKPGVFQLEIRPGRGREIFEMKSVGNEGWNSLSVQEVGNEITVTSFEGLTLYPRLARRKGMEEADVLADLETHEVEPESIIEDVVSRVTSLFKSKQGRKDLDIKGDDQAEINIFTVASGLLYERFVSIMILSVLRNTKSSVKFWFIENFLSPSFLEFIPHLADAYGFKYELVTYKWPSWLRAQSEKQRIIWAYKILFLDVLFPMDLKKVIFVDADQIVRADLKELVELDLHGAPYGYTPMGDDNPDMEGFRFWKTGYWKDFLRGLPYHISALYVVDLVRFRQVAAGDILRGQYQQLSADPNSLANLDQDLPNNIQREVPIFSLHEDWLWCETWCSKDRLHRAKTIDLCQNPLTKEPKLARARQIPEWEEYDAEISRFARKLAAEGLIRSHIATADTNVLANFNTGSVTDNSPEELNEQGIEREDVPTRDEL